MAAAAETDIGRHMNKDLMFSSRTDDWATPQCLFNQLDAVFRFRLDVCASKNNAKCANYYTAEEDGLDQEWHGNCWMNPPYGRTIGKWVAKAYESAKHNGATVVCLLPSRTDTRWWHDYCIHGEITFLRGRLRFGDAKHAAPFPSALVVFRPSVGDAIK